MGKWVIILLLLFIISGCISNENITDRTIYTEISRTPDGDYKGTTVTVGASISF